MEILNDNRDPKPTEKSENNSDTPGNVGGLLFAGCMFIGAGIGFIVGNVKAGAALGMGIGFLVMAAFWMKYKK